MIAAAWAEIRLHPGRLVSTALATVISVAFMVACLSFVATETHAIGQRLTADTSTSDVVVRLDDDPEGTRQRRIAELPGVAASAPTYAGYVEFSSPGGAGQLQLHSLPPEQFRWSHLTAGTWPEGPDQVALGATAADSYHVRVGDSITVAGAAASGPAASGSAPLRVVGVVDESGSLLGQVQSTAVVADSYFTGATSDAYTPTLLVKAEPGIDPEALASRIQPLLGADNSVDTSAALTEQTLDRMTDDAAVFRYLLMIFAAIALLVGGMIIINTFTIIVAQRRRQLGLLRAVGASTHQVRGQLVAEATLIGVFGSGLGVVLGIMITVVATMISGSWGTGLVVPPAQLLAAFGAGVVITWLAALVPAHRATRVSPLEALSPVADAGTGRRSTRLRVMTSGLLILTGAGGTAYALQRDGNNVAFTVIGSFVLSVGILAAAPLFLPYALRALGAVAGRTGVIGRLASANLLRNPSRAAATSTALMLAVGMIVTLQVGSASLQATTADSLDREFPVDVTVTNPSGPLDAGVLPAVAAVPGVRAISPVRLTQVQVSQPGAGVDHVAVAGLGPDAAAVVSAGFDELDDGVALAPSSTLAMLDRQAGDRISLVGAGGRETLTLRASDVADSGTLVVTRSSMEGLDPHAPLAGVWAAAADRESAAEVIAGVRRAAAQQPGLDIGGSLEEAASISALLDTLLAVATALLAVAVAIALVGVGNTLGLSVLERTRESALLRALGLQRRQLRLMLLVEAVLLAVVGAVVGIGAGVLFGTVGVQAMVTETSLGAMHFAMSGANTAAVVAVTALAGALASILPGRRAAMATPTAALADA